MASDLVYFLGTLGSSILAPRIIRSETLILSLANFIQLNQHIYNIFNQKLTIGHKFRGEYHATLRV